VDEFLQRVRDDLQVRERAEKRMREVLRPSGVSTSDPLLVWLDIETTGLDPRGDEVLEVGMVVTTVDPFDEVGWEASWIVRPSDWPHVKARMEARPLEMHSANGLIEALDAGEGFELRTVLERMSQMISVFSRGHEAYLAGSSVHFDKRFLEAHNPDVFKGLSHRIVDVSTLDVLLRAVNPSAVPVLDVKPTHRVMDCLETSRLLYSAYLKAFTPVGDFAGKEN
jgi:oligoribonuclease